MRTLVFSDDYECLLEALSIPLENGIDSKEIYAASLNGEQNKSPIVYGAGYWLRLKGKANAAFLPKVISNTLHQVIKQYNISLVLIGGTKLGIDVAPRLAHKFGLDYVPNAIAVRISGDEVITDRIVYSGKVIFREKLIRSPYIITVPPRMLEKPQEDASRKGEVIEVPLSLEDINIDILDIKEVKREVEIEKAQKIVSVGRGFKSKEDMKLAFELAELLKAEVGCSRPIAADLKWLSEDRWIGLSGHKVRPDLYIAIGISGQIQHIAGMRDSKIIVAINNDPDAPIFKYADYGIVGDLYKVIPALINRLKKMK